jgi:hypothetical protein
VFFAVDCVVVFEAFEVSDDLGGSAEGGGQAVFDDRGEAVGFADGGGSGKEEVDLDDLARGKGSFDKLRAGPSTRSGSALRRSG